jgi:hypothetical protein
MVSQELYWTGNKFQTLPPDKEIKVLKHRIHMATCYLRSDDKENALRYLDYDNEKRYKTLRRHP